MRERLFADCKSVFSRRPVLPFRRVNRPRYPGYDPALQRHHILPLQMLSRRTFAAMLDRLGHTLIGFDDFRRNGLLLPARDSAALRLSLPLHRGPHRHYNTLVMERVGQIEARWSAYRTRSQNEADAEAVMRLALLQRALRRRLLNPPGRPFRLNRYDPVGAGFDFTDLDAMAESLWGATQNIAASRAIFAS
ncbi:AHH domain-containing protein [Tsuneonella suprasediminis]|uniref:AHH domain-containing protein n=1 Tax=Tsuneonella suprasediminis TaxID=2306996 RepID=UPI002F930F68